MVEEGRGLRKLPLTSSFFTSKAIWRSCCPLTNLKDKLGLSWTQVAIRSDVHKRTLERIYMGQRLMTNETTRKVAEALEVDPGALLHLYLEWLSLEPTLESHHMKKNADESMKWTNPFFRLMKQKGMKLDDILEETGLSMRTVRYLMNDPDTDPSLTTLELVSACLGVSPADVIEDYRRWQDTYQHLTPSDRIVASLELEAELDAEGK